MSASRERKKRMTQEPAPVQQTSKKKKKISDGAILAICVVLVLAIVFGGIAIYRGYWTDAVVLTVGEHEITTGEFSIYYGAQVNALSQYTSYFGIDTTTALDKQTIGESGLSMMQLFGYDTTGVVAGETTWAQFFARSAMKTAAAYYGVYIEAQKAGFTLGEDALAEIDEVIASMESMAGMYGVSLEEYLQAQYGKDCDEAAYRRYAEVNQYYYYYADEVRTNYTTEELTAHREESPEDFEFATFYLFSSTAADFLDEGEEEITEKALTDAKVAAEAMVAEFDMENEKVALRADYTRATVESNINEEAAAWIFDEAAADEIKLFEKTVTNEETGEETVTWYVLKMVNREDYDTANVLSIFVADEEAEEAGAEATEGANAQTIRDALAEDASEESFRDLLSYSDYDTTEYANADRSDFAGYEEIYAWMFGEDRAEGDHQEFAVDGGVYFFFFTGYGEPKQEFELRNALQTEWATSVIEAAQESCIYDEKAAMHAFVGIYG